MRITGGNVRGRRLAPFRGMDIRPTSDLVREAIFDLLGLNLSGARVLDLFAGTGSLGIEALSRGAGEAVFVDRSHKAIDLIGRNLKVCGLEEKGLVLMKDLTRGLPSRHRLTVPCFDLVFLDPPYGRGLIMPLLDELQSEGLLASPAAVVAQTDKRENLPNNVTNLKTVKVRTYGTTEITILINEENP